MIRNTIQTDFYGDDIRWFVGIVINATPPDGFEGKVKVRIHGIHNNSTADVPESDIPWASVVLPVTEGGVSGIGKIPQILPGAQVFGVFADGISSQLPIVLGSIPRDEFPSTLQKNIVYSSEENYFVNQTSLSNPVMTPLKDDSVIKSKNQLRRHQGMKFFIDNGYSLIHAAAIVGNLEKKSNYILFSETSDTVGIAGWKKTQQIGSRFANLIDFCKELTPSEYFITYSAQLKFVLYELRNSFSKANRKLLQTNKVDDGADIISKYYILDTQLNAKLNAQNAYDEVIAL